MRCWSEVLEVFEVEPVLISGVNGWIFRNRKLYESALRRAIEVAEQLGII